MNALATKKANGEAIDAPHDWHPADVIAALHKAVMSMSKLARSHGLSTSGTLSKALRSSYPIAEKRIADAIGVEPKVIWPSRYYDNGTPRPRGFHAIQFNASEPRCNDNVAAVNSHEAA